MTCLTRRAVLGGGAALLAAAAAGPAGAAIRCGQWMQPGYRQCEVGLDQNLGAFVAAGSQQQSYWCWAASISAIFAYYGHPVAQERIVAKVFGQTVNLPAYGRQIAAATEGSWIDERGRPFQAGCEVLWDQDAFFGRPDALAETAWELSAGNPLIIGCISHAMVLTALLYTLDQTGGIWPQAVTVRDPWPGQGRRYLSPQEVAGTRFLAKVRLL